MLILWCYFNLKYFLIKYLSNACYLIYFFSNDCLINILFNPFYIVIKIKKFFTFNPYHFFIEN